MLRKIIECESLDISQENFYDGVSFSKAASLHCSGCNFTIQKTHYRLFVKYVLKTSCLKKNNKFQKQSPRVFFKKGVLRNFAKFTGKYLSQSLFLIKLQYSCEFCKISKNTFCYATPPVAASEVSEKKFFQRSS